MLRRLGGEVIDVDVAARIARHHTTSMPAMLAEAGLVPCADEGIRQILRAARRARCDSRGSRAAGISPCAPEFGCSEIAS